MVAFEQRTTVAMTTLAVFVGPAHVMVAVNDAWRERFGEPTFGVPIREAWTDPVWRPVQDLMDKVYETGKIALFPWAEGTTLLAPVTVRGCRGVGASLLSLPLPDLGALPGLLGSLLPPELMASHP